MKGIQTEHSKIESEFQREILEIEKKVRFKYHSAHVMSVSSDTR